MIAGVAGHNPIEDEEAQVLVNESMASLEDEWSFRVGRSTQSPGRSLTSKFFRLGEKFGKHQIDPKHIKAAITAKLRALSEREACLIEGELVELEHQASSVIGRELPSRLADLSSVRDELDNNKAANKGRGWKGSIWECLVYTVLAFAPVLAEFGLASQATEEALELRFPTLFALALGAASTLTCKLLADIYFSTDSDKQEVNQPRRIYLHVMLFIFIILMAPLSYLRTLAVSGDEDSKAFESQIESALKQSANYQLQNGETANDGDNEAEDHQPSVGSKGPFWARVISFFLSAILFSALSGAAFSLLQSSLDVFFKTKSLRMLLLRRELRALNKEVEVLSFVGGILARERSKRLALVPNPRSHMAFLIRRIVSLMNDEKDAAGFEAAARQLAEFPSTKSFDSFDAKVREGSLESRERATLEHYLDVLREMIARDDGKLLSIQKSMQEECSAEIDAGHVSGSATGYRIFSGKSVGELLHDLDLQAFHARFFKNAVNGSAEDSWGVKHEKDVANS